MVRFMVVDARCNFEIKLFANQLLIVLFARISAYCFMIVSYLITLLSNMTFANTS